MSGRPEDPALGDAACERGELLPARAWRRIAATILDMAVFLALSCALALPLVLRFPPAARRRPAAEMIAAVAADHTYLRLAALVLVLWVVLWLAYFIVGWGVFGATPGQWALGLRVVDHRGRCPIGAPRAALRLVAYCVGSFPLLAGHLLAFFRADARTLHDILAGTRIVRRRRPLKNSDGRNGLEA